jgi:multidrug efflux pump subunit AcrB
MAKVADKASRYWEAAKALPQKAKQMMKFQEKLDKLKDSANKLYEHIVNIIVVFILQTIIIPIFFLWAMYKLGIGFVRSVKTGKAE